MRLFWSVLSALVIIGREEPAVRTQEVVESAVGSEEPALATTVDGAFLREPLSVRVGSVRCLLTGREVTGRFALRFQAWLRFAIGTQRGHAATTEPVFDFIAGPIVTAATGPVGIFAQAGPSAFEFANSPSRLGVAALAGLGGA